MTPFLFSKGTLVQLTVQLAELIFVMVMLLGGASGTDKDKIENLGLLNRN